MTYDSKKLRDLIPEYLNGRLSKRDQTEFENGLDIYPDVKKEVREFTGIKSAYNTMQDDLPSPSDAVFQKVMRRIKPEQKATDFNGLGIFEHMRRFFEPLFTSPRVSWTVVGVQMAVILLLTVSAPREDRFATLTSQQAGQIKGAMIHVVFAPDAMEIEIRNILNQFEGVIINGPSFEGLYTIKINEDRNIEKTIEALKKNKAVKFAEKGYFSSSK